MKLAVLLLFIVIFQFQVVAQTPVNIKIDVKQTSLNQVLLKLKEEYGFQFAFDKDLLSKYSVTVNKTFHTQEGALLFLVKDLPLKVEKTGDVFLIIPYSGETKQESVKVYTRISGQVMEAQTYEPLPFSYILINNKAVQSDQQGQFAYLASADSSYSLRISHLGYFIYDTLVTGNINRRFLLKPQTMKIKEIEVEGNIVEKSTLIGDRPGKMKINHRIAPVLPGYGDNSVFNMLRLLPGVLAAGEQSTDPVIWGSYESHSKILFDGFTIFGLKNFNDDIGVINPLVLKDMEVHKGGYEAKYGDCVGGIVNITGKNGNQQKPSFTFNLNNTTVNSLLEVPLTNNSTLLAAYRQTYYELYNPSDLQLFERKGRNERNIDVTLVPEYNFRDGNLKYTWQNERTSVEISSYGGGDNYSYSIETPVGNTNISRSEEEKNRQWGGSFSVNYNLKSGNAVKILAGWSSFSNLSEEENKTTNKHNGKERILKQGGGENNVGQTNILQESRINFENGHYLEFGIGFESNTVLILRNLFEDELINSDTRLQRGFAFVQDILPVTQRLELKTGIRANYIFELNKFYPEPRISASLKLTDKVRLNAAWGLYHQYIAKTTLVDSTLNYYYFWVNANNSTIPVLSGQQCVGGISYNKNGFSASVEGYFKTTDGLSRFVNGTSLLQRGFYSGEGRSYGVDFYLKKEYKKHMAWLSYTLSKTEEHFPFYIRNYYHPAPQDQRHELKLAGIFNYRSFYFSANYVFGSGFERFLLTDDNGNEYVPSYKRLDTAIIYHFKPGKVNTEVGISVLNVLNDENIKLSNIRRVATETEDPLDIHTEAIPFTPTLFLKMRF